MIVNLVRACVENEDFGKRFCMDCPANLDVGCGMFECPTGRDMTDPVCVRSRKWMDLEAGLKAMEREIEDGLSNEPAAQAF